MVSTRPDPSDSGMAYFLLTGDEEADPSKYKRLLDEKVVPRPVDFRSKVRIEAENFITLDGYEMEITDRRPGPNQLTACPIARESSRPKVWKSAVSARVSASHTRRLEVDMTWRSDIPTSRVDAPGSHCLSKAQREGTHGSQRGQGKAGPAIRFVMSKSAPATRSAST